MAEHPFSAAEQMQAFAQRWWSIATHPLQAFAEWLTPRFRPEAHRRFLISDTEGAVTVERAIRDDGRRMAAPDGVAVGPQQRPMHDESPAAWPEARVVASDDAKLFYSMSPADHEAWARGGEAASEVELHIREGIQHAGETGRIEVLTPSGSPAFHLAVRAQHEPTREAPRSLLEQIAALRDRLEASPQALQPTPQRDQGMGL